MQKSIKPAVVDLALELLIELHWKKGLELSTKVAEEEKSWRNSDTFYARGTPTLSVGQ